jgi:hypothetical protein
MLELSQQYISFTTLRVAILLILFSSVILRCIVDSNPQWCCTYILEASDPLFVEIGKSFIEEQIKGRMSYLKLNSNIMMHGILIETYSK